MVLKDYLEPQFRAASDSDAEVRFILRFEPPLPPQGPSAEGLIQRLTRLVSPRLTSGNRRRHRNLDKYNGTKYQFSSRQVAPESAFAASGLRWLALPSAQVRTTAAEPH